jgi:hypothetical protein
MGKLKLLTISIIGSIIGYYVIDLFILDLSIIQYLLIEVVVSVIHYMYQKAKYETINI